MNILTCSVGINQRVRQERIYSVYSESWEKLFRHQIIFKIAEIDKSHKLCDTLFTKYHHTSYC